MAIQSVTNQFESKRTISARQDWLTAAALALLALIPAVVNGSIADWSPDNDSMMRLVQIRDLVSGQGWYDYMQYRMGPDGGFVMHWSRIVDLPVAAIIIVVASVTGSTALGELVAGIVWPSALLAISLVAIIRSARDLGDDTAVLPAALIGVTSLYSIGIFAPGTLDHHNLQLTLCLIALWAISGGYSTRHGFRAGAAMALTMAIGMETLPLVAAACGGIAAAYLVLGNRLSAMAFGFGTGFAAISAGAFFATVGPDYWLTVHCDAFSVAQLSIAAVGGLGLAAAGRIPAAQRNFSVRAGLLGTLAIALIMLVAGAYPQCLADPYAGLDPRLTSLWLSAVSEAQPVFNVWLHDPVMFAKYYATPLAAIAVLAAAIAGGATRLAHAMTACFLLVALAVSFWQVRGANFSVAIAIIPLAAWVGEKRSMANSGNGAGATIAMALAWVISLNACWTVAGQALRDATQPAVAAEDAEGAGDRGFACYGAPALKLLASIEQQTVVAVSNLGPAILKYSPHRTLAGPYHRNIDGNIAALDILLNEPVPALEALRAAGVSLVVHCPDDDESAALAEAAPKGLIAALMRNEVPIYLSAADTGVMGPVKIYRLKLK